MRRWPERPQVRARSQVSVQLLSTLGALGPSTGFWVRTLFDMGLHLTPRAAPVLPCPPGRTFFAQG